MDSELKIVLNELIYCHSKLKKLSDSDKKTILRDYRNLLKEFSTEEIIVAIKSLSYQSTFIPTVAEIRSEISKIRKYKTSNLSNVNLNSSYWYANLRDLDGPYYDIETGKALKPFK